MLIAQLSDFHARPAGVAAYAGLDTCALMRQAIAAVNALDPLPDCVIVSGDLTDCGLAAEYEAVAEALSALPMPCYLIPGNHDRRETMREVLGSRFPTLMQDTAFLHYVVDDFSVRLIGLDTVVAGEHGGEICPVRQAWLAGTLEAGGGRPTLIVMHHPPFRTGVPAMDPMMCRTSPAFENLIQDHPEIGLIATGHYHRPIVCRYAGAIGFVAPGTAHQVAFDLRPGQPTRLIHEPPGFAVHSHSAADGFVSHIIPIGVFGPIHEFELPAEYPGQS
jgi:Icc protein